MSYNQMMGSHNNRNSYIPEYDNSSYKMMNPTSTFNQYPPNQVYSGQNLSSNSVALFHVPADATNSLYVDGVPNDTSEREVSRKFMHLNRYFSSFSWLPMYPLDQEKYLNRTIIFLVLC